MVVFGLYLMECCSDGLLPKYLLRRYNIFVFVFISFASKNINYFISSFYWSWFRLFIYFSGKQGQILFAKFYYKTFFNIGLNRKVWKVYPKISDISPFASILFYNFFFQPNQFHRKIISVIMLLLKFYCFFQIYKKYYSQYFVLIIVYFIIKIFISGLWFHFQFNVQVRNIFL